jgi:hypothetical protein
MQMVPRVSQWRLDNRGKVFIRQASLNAWWHLCNYYAKSEWIFYLLINSLIHLAGVALSYPAKIA